MIEKLRVDKSVAKYKEYLESLKDFGLSLKDLEIEKLKDLKTWESYHPCGPDADGRSVMFLAGDGIQVEDEASAVRSGFAYWMAVHSDPVSIREGITFIIDSSQNSKPVGNERKMQKVWSSLAMRPQHFFIVGASFIKRVFINALIKFASIFSNAKVLKRIKFAERKDVEKVIPEQNRPKFYGGPIDESAYEFVKARLAVSEAWFK